MCHMGLEVLLEIKSIFSTARQGFRDFKTSLLLEIQRIASQ